jgi:hypothetical protein
VAIGTLHLCVPSAQRKLSLRMVEFNLGAQRLPALRGVTLLALNPQLVAMWAMKRSLKRNVLTERNAAWKENEEEEKKGPGIRQTIFL